jgi:hypothetical protein
MKKDHFKTQNKALNALEQLGIELGVDPDTTNPMNALRSVTKAVSDLAKLDQTAHEMGYKSVAIALKALKQYKKDNTEIDTTSLPEVFHKESQAWVLGRPKGTLGKDDKGFPPLRPRDAQLQYRGILPWLLEAWRMADTYSNGDEVRDELITRYLSYSPDEFERLCYMRINDMEEPDLQTELNRRIEKNASAFEVSKSLRTVTDIDYGVGGTLEPPAWND